MMNRHSVLQEMRHDDEIILDGESEEEGMKGIRMEENL
jgi:hypothetical protein